jgi:hypothetical protein
MLHVWIQKPQTKYKSRGKKYVQLFLWQIVEENRFVRRRGFPIFQTIGTQMAVKSSAAHWPLQDSWHFVLEDESTQCHSAVGNEVKNLKVN